jgi:hypothetical protein
MHPLVGNCRCCGYSLVHLTTPRCPECGTMFDPDDPSTMEIHRSALVEFLSKPMPLWAWCIPGTLLIGAICSHLSSGHPSTLTGILMMAGIFSGLVTLYFASAKARFQRWMKKRKASSKPAD